MSGYRHVGCLSLSFLSSTHSHHLRARERSPFGKMESKSGKGKHWFSEVHTQEEEALLVYCLSLQWSMMHSFILIKTMLQNKRCNKKNSISSLISSMTSIQIGVIHILTITTWYSCHFPYKLHVCHPLAPDCCMFSCFSLLKAAFFWYFVFRFFFWLPSCPNMTTIHCINSRFGIQV